MLADAADGALAFNPLIGLRGRDVAAAAGALLDAVVKSPKEATAFLGAYAKDLGKVVVGASDAMPDPKDRRLADPAWRSNFLCKRLMQAHCVTQESLARFSDRSSLDERRKGRAHFFTSLGTDAIAPRSWLVSIPV